MQKIIRYVIVFCLFVTQLPAQSNEPATQLLAGLHKGVNDIIKDKDAPEVCRKKMKQFEKSFSVTPGVLNEVAKKQVTKNIESFIIFYNATANKNCLGPKTQLLMKSAVQLQAELTKGQTVKTPPNAAAVARSDSDGSKSAAMMPTVRDSAASLPHVEVDTAESIVKSDSGSVVEPLQSGSSASSYNYIVWLIFASLVLSIITLVQTFVSLKTLNKIKTTLEQKSESTADEAIAPLPLVEAVETKPEEEEVVAAPQIAAPVLPDAVIISSFFVCEIMMTAGPRKKFMGEENADKDLGEDVCGFLALQDKVLVWLLDGTSDLHCLRNPVNKLEYFSSRLLALGISEKLKSIFFEAAGKMPINEMVKKAIEQVKSNWIKEIEKLPEQEQQVLKLNIESKNYPECAATILIAELHLNGELTAYRSGDSKMLLFKNVGNNSIDFLDTSLVEKNEKSDDRIFFRLRLDESGKFDIICNEPLHEVLVEKDIHSLISFSDGIGKETEQKLITEFKSNPEKARNDIIYHSQQTGDDKSICFIGIRKPANQEPTPVAAEA